MAAAESTDGFSPRVRLAGQDDAGTGSHLAWLQVHEKAGGGREVALGADAVVCHEVDSRRQHLDALELVPHQVHLQVNAHLLNLRFLLRNAKKCRQVHLQVSARLINLTSLLRNAFIKECYQMHVQASARLISLVSLLQRACVKMCCQGMLRCTAGLSNLLSCWEAGFCSPSICVVKGVGLACWSTPKAVP